MARLNTGVSIAEVIRQIDDLPRSSRHADEWLRVGPVKLTFDGEIGTAWMRQPYPGRPAYFGRTYLETGAVREIVQAAVKRQRPVAVHTLGGAAIDALLEILAAIAPGSAAPNGHSLRHSLMHVFFPSVANLQRCRELGVVLSMQPLLFHVYGPSMIREWGLEAASAASPLRDIVHSGVMTGAGSDVIPFDPLLSVWSAVTRRVKGGFVLGDAQALSPGEALWLHTQGAALISGEEAIKGSLQVGKIADIAILSDDPLSSPVDLIKETRVIMTLVGGEIAYDARETAAAGEN
jgi:predicted amidohydrolase YtcJ